MRFCYLKTHEHKQNYDKSPEYDNKITKIGKIVAQFKAHSE